MALEGSILVTTKKMLNVGKEDTSFDLDIITHINTAFSTLAQLGVGPAEGYMIEDADATWAEFLEIHVSPTKLNLVKTLVFAKVRMMFDPPTNAFLVTAYERQIEELEWRAMMEGDTWVAPQVVDRLGDNE